MHVLRRYTDLNENEIAALSDEDVKKYVEIEMAYKGIPILELTSLFGQTREYTDIQEEIDKIYCKITHYRDDICLKLNQKQALVAAYDHYLKLSNNDANIAFNFLLRAYLNILKKHPDIEQSIISTGIGIEHSE